MLNRQLPVVSSDLDLLVVEYEIADKSAEYLRLHRAISSIGGNNMGRITIMSP